MHILTCLSAQPRLCDNHELSAITLHLWPTTFTDLSQQRPVTISKQQSGAVMRGLKGKFDVRSSYKFLLSVLVVLTGLTFRMLLPSRAASTTTSATITVTTTADTVATDGGCSLREAIQAANSNVAVNECAAGMAGMDVIQFSLGTGTPSIAVMGAALPTITEPVQILGNTGGATRVELNGEGAGAGSDGLTITAGNSLVRNLVINRFSGDGIQLQTGGGNIIEGCYLGTDNTGTVSLGNLVGLRILDAPNNLIGGTSEGARNLISGNSIGGISISGSSAAGNRVEGNFIGTDVTGTLDLGNMGTGIGSAAPNTVIGGTIAGARNLISGNNGNGVALGFDATSSRVEGNFIGTDVTGTLDLGNRNSGVALSAASNNVIGGKVVEARNLISGNDGSGISFGNARDNRVEGNFIGTDVTGTADLGNSYGGIDMYESSNNVIGGTVVGARNLISGNNGSGIFIGSEFSLTASNRVLGNYIGTDVNGTADLGNGGCGVYISGTLNNVIGGTTTGAGNLIAFNDACGIGVTHWGFFDIYPTGNAILGNSIFSSGALGIDLNQTGVTANDLGDGDIGPNNQQNFPVLSSATSNGSSTTITGTLNSTANRSFTIQFFANLVCDGSSHGEGQFLLGQTTVTTDGSGNAVINATLNAAAPNNSFITATATDATGNTSEFSACITASGPTCGYVITPTSRAFAANGGSSSFSVTAINGCSWMATSNDPSWIIINSGNAGSGNGTVNYTVAPHSGLAPRTGTITLTYGLTFTVRQGVRFNDVPETHPFYEFIGKLSARGITLGCGGGNFCPDGNVTREQAAIFIERALGIFNPPPGPMMPTFADVPNSGATDYSYEFIEDFAARDITQGCATGPPRLYCPTTSVTREQMAIFILRALGVFTPPQGPYTPTFADVPDSGATNYSYEFIEEFYARGIAAGCQAGPPRLYCPTSAVTRGQMAAFLARAFNL
jgi:CSLREA domain-containing protein